MKKKFLVLLLVLSCWFSLYPKSVFAGNLEQGLRSVAFQSTDVATPTETAAPAATLTPIPPPTETSTSTSVPVPTSTDTPIPAALSPTAYTRPLMVITSYSSKPSAPKPGEEFTLSVVIKNIGVSTGQYIQVSFPSDNFIPLENGGVFSVPDLEANTSYKIKQNFILSPSIGEGIKTITVGVNYVDHNGTAFSDKLNLAVSVASAATTGYAAAPTATPTTLPGVVAQLNIKSFSVEPAILEPGSVFKLNMQIANIGGQKASKSSMIFGGGSLSGSGIDGSSGNLSVFGLLNSSNIIPIGNIEAGEEIPVSQTVIVNNVNAAGAYNLRISFIHYDDKGGKFLDDQLIVLQIMTKPRIIVDFYTPFQSVLNQPVAIPLRITNSRSTAIYIEKIEIKGDAWDITPPIIQVGKIDGDDNWTVENLTGTALKTGATELIVDIYYFDDFNRVQKISTPINIQILGGLGDSPIAPTAIPGNNSLNDEVNNGSQTNPTSIIYRFILGIFGLDSSVPANNNYLDSLAPSNVQDGQEPTNVSVSPAP
jgi:hypothetical protein